MVPYCVRATEIMIHWQNIDTVLLDMDGTLLDLHFDNYFWSQHLPIRYSEEHGVSERDAREHISERIAEKRGTLQWYCLDHWSDLMDLNIPLLKEEIKHKIQLRPHVEAFLLRLQAHGKKRVLITNAHPKGLELKLAMTGIDRWLDSIISAHEFRSPKEDRAFWEQLQLREPFDTKRTVFIDDTACVLRSAADYGIDQLVRIIQPDSQGETHSNEEFIGISHFDEIMPSEMVGKS